MMMVPPSRELVARSSVTKLTTTYEPQLFECRQHPVDGDAIDAHQKRELSKLIDTKRPVLRDQGLQDRNSRLSPTKSCLL